MNNVVLGNERFTYYETIGGGQGACPDADGPSGVHVAMSNTLNTPVEALELALPAPGRALRAADRLRRGGRSSAAATGSSASSASSSPSGSRCSPSAGQGPARRRRRRTGRGGPQPRKRRGAAGIRLARPRARGRSPHRDARRRGVRTRPLTEPPDLPHASAGGLTLARSDPPASTNRAVRATSSVELPRRRLSRSLPRRECSSRWRRMGP